VGTWRGGYTRVIGQGTVIVVLAYVLHQAGVRRVPVAFWVVLSIAFLAVAESDFLHRPHYEGPPELEELLLRRSATRRLVEIGLLLLSAFGFFWLYKPVSTPADRNPVTVQHLDEIEKDLSLYLNTREDSSKQSVSSGTETVTVRLSPELEAILIDEIQHPRNSEAGPSLWTVIITSAILLLAGLLVGWALWHRPAATPLAMSLGLAMAVISAAPKLPRLGGVDFWRVVYGLGGIGALLLLAGGVQQVYRSHRVSAKRLGDPQSYCKQENLQAGANEASRIGWFRACVQRAWTAWTRARSIAKDRDSFLSLGFSLLVLTWSILLVTQRPSVDAPPPDHLQSLGATESPLSQRRPKFEKGSWEPNNPSEIDALKERLPEKGKGRGDVLLLIPSADCTPLKPRVNGPRNNTELAEYRADRVRRILKDSGFGGPDDLEIRAEVMPQRDGCDEDKDLRTVFPFLITPTEINPPRPPTER